MGIESKTAIKVGDRTLLDWAVHAVRDAGRIIVVGPECETILPVIWAREDPVGGGPAAAIDAGMTALDRLPLDPAPPDPASRTVVVLAGDVPFAQSAIPRLLRTAADHDVAVLVDPSGRDQLLIAAWHVTALRSRLSDLEIGGSSVRALFDNASVTRVLASEPETLDCDEPSDIQRALQFDEAARGSI
jgi:molybdopterin-guanine dinucleotide biosynthesis protein A